MVFALRIALGLRPQAKTIFHGMSLLLSTYCYSILDRNVIMSVLGLKLGYIVKYDLSPRDFPKAQPEGNPPNTDTVSHR